MDTSVLYVSPPASHSNQSFVVQLVLNLSSSEAFNAYDTQLTYNSTTLNVQSLTVSSQEQEIAHCIDGVGMACNISDGPGVIHSAADFSTILQGPITKLMGREQVSSILSMILLLTPTLRRILSSTLHWTDSIRTTAWLPFSMSRLRFR